MIAAVKIDIKQPEIKRTGSLSYNFLQEDLLLKLETI